MRSETGKIKSYYSGYYLEVYPFNTGERSFWAARVSDKNWKYVKEFYDTNRTLVKLKGLEWINSRDLKNGKT